MLIVSSNNEIAAQRKRIAGIKGGFDKAFKRASARVATQGRTEISKGIRTHINIKAGDLKNELKVAKHKTGASITLRESDRLSLKYFDAKQNKKGVTYKINKGRGRGFIPSAFIVNKLGGNVFKRVSKSRLPISKLMGASAWGTFVVKSMYKPTGRDLDQKFNQRLRHEIDFLMSKGRPRG